MKIVDELCEILDAKAKEIELRNTLCISGDDYVRLSNIITKICVQNSIPMAERRDLANLGFTVFGLDNG